MKLGITLGAIALAGIILAAVAATPVQDATARKPAPAAAAGSAAQNAGGARDVSAMLPNEHHALLAQMVGRWTLAGRMMPAPGMEFPIGGSSELQSIMGGRFITETAHGGPTPTGNFEGMGVYGFDNRTGKFEAVWFNNQSTAIISQTGDEDPATHGIVWHSEQPNMMTGKPETHRSTMQKASDTSWKFEDYVSANGAESLVMEMTYTRAP